MNSDECNVSQNAAAIPFLSAGLGAIKNVHFQRLIKDNDPQPLPARIPMHLFDKD